MTARRPAPLERLDAARLRAVQGVLTDIDDTLTRDGAIEPPALAALQALRDAGIPVVAVTGRPAGWSRPFVAPPPHGWPIDAIVAENGAVALFVESGQQRVEYAQDEATRRRNAERLRAVADRVLREVPGASLARDSAGRVTDIAIDHSECACLDAAGIAQVLAIMRAEGMQASVSSIHVNGWFGEHDKPSGARWVVRRLYGRELDAERDRWLYVGDSPNDQPMFATFPLSVGVANLLRFERELHTWPACITRGERGDGFAEVARALLDARA